MADPFTMVVAGVGMAASAVGAGISAYGSMQKGASERAMYQYRAAIADMNAKIAQQNADYELAIGGIEAQRAGMKGRFERGAIITKQGKSNIDIGSGTNVEVVDSHTKISKYDQDTIRQNALRRAYGHRVSAAQETAQGNLYTRAGDDAKKAGTLGAIGSLVSGASSVSSKWMQGSSAGIW